jgi:hypothetical protein
LGLESTSPVAIGERVLVLAASALDFFQVRSNKVTYRLIPREKECMMVFRGDEVLGSRSLIFLERLGAKLVVVASSSRFDVVVTAKAAKMSQSPYRDRLSAALGSRDPGPLRLHFLGADL